MQENARSWNDKIKLAMCELERKLSPGDTRDTMAGSDSHGRSEQWPRKEQVDAWNSERQHRRGGGQYCGGSSQEVTITKEEKKRKSFISSVCLQVVKSAAFALATIALIQGVSKHLPDSITVSSSVGGRELPIYCVETDKKQVALSFDAAWGNGRLMERNYRAVSFLW